MLKALTVILLGTAIWCLLHALCLPAQLSIPRAWCMCCYPQEDKTFVSVSLLCTIQQSEIAVLQVEALCALKRHQEAAETLDTIAQHDRAFSKSKDFKSLLKQVQAVA